MTLSQLNPDDTTRPEPFRWTRSLTTQTVHDCHDSQTSQRQFAQQAGVPRSTLQYWHKQRQHPDLDPLLADFLESPAGYRFLRRLVLALHLVFHLAGHAGLRLLGQFLRLSQLDRFVAASYGVQQAFASQLQDDLITFAAEERSRLGATMTPRTITACLDENFHGAQICLVAMEPLSNFILVEAYNDRRDGLTWTLTIREAIAGLPVEVIQITSDQAKGLLSCARDGFDAHYSPDLFHLQQELTHGLSLPLQRRTTPLPRNWLKNSVKRWSNVRSNSSTSRAPSRWDVPPTSPRLCSGVGVGRLGQSAIWQRASNARNRAVWRCVVWPMTTTPLTRPPAKS